MDKIERVVAALTGKTPDMVPYIYNTVMRSVQEQIVGRAITDPTVDGMNITGWLGPPGEKAEIIPSLSAIPDVALRLGMDAIEIQVLPPIFCDYSIQGSDKFVTSGLIDSEGAYLKACSSMPDPDDEKLLRTIEGMISMYKGDLAMGARVRLGASPCILSMGLENLAVLYAEEDETLQNTIEMYTDWSRRMNKNLSELDFDFFWCFDDIAFSSSMLISPAMFRELFKTPMKKAADAIRQPLIFHSDGNYQQVLDDIIEIGADGIHPIEISSMDSRWLKENYGHMLCLVGNIDIDFTLSSGTPEQVDAEVLERIGLFGPGGRYIISDSNSIPGFCKAENVIAMAQAVEKYRRIY